MTDEFKSSPLSAIHPDRTRIAMPVVMAGGLVAALLGAGYYAGQKLQSLAYEIDGLKTQIHSLPKRDDFEKVQRQVDERRGAEILVLCPKQVPRGDSWIACRGLPQK